jgi:hypothetical protein
MTMRPIDADKLIEWLTNSTGFLANCEDCNSYGRECVLCIVEEAIQNAPTIEAEPARHGIWTTMVHTDTGEFAGYKCSECGIVEYRNYDRCRCGAIMDGGAEE